MDLDKHHHLRAADAPKPEAEEAEKGSWRERMGDRVNGKTLDTLEWGTSILNVPPSAHRLKSALGLAVGLFLGAELMKTMTGVDMRGNKVDLDKVSSLLDPIKNALPYDYHSDLPYDRWMRVTHTLVPGVLGAIGAYYGSKQFFSKREEAAKDPEFLDDFERAAEMAQSKPWGKMAGFSSMWSSVSGFNWLPIPNYGLSLGSRFTLASGRKVALPGVGKIWSNNHSIYPFGAPELINHMIDYATHNPSGDPKQLEAMAQGILGDWFKGATPEHVSAFVNEVKSIRDDFLRDGGVPEALKEELQNELKAHLKGAGLEETLERIGLDPLNAEIGANGFSGKIAELVGAGKKVDALRESYVEKYRERQQDREHSGPSIV